MEVKTSLKIKSASQTLTSRGAPEQPSPRTAHRLGYLRSGVLRIPLSCHGKAQMGYFETKTRPLLPCYVCFCCET